MFVYEDNLNVYELMDSSNIMDKYFHYEDVYEEEKWSMWLHGWKSRATLWWDEMQECMKKKGKTKIISYVRMVEKFKGTLIPKYYQLNSFNLLQNIKQESMKVMKCNE